MVGETGQRQSPGSPGAAGRGFHGVDSPGIRPTSGRARERRARKARCWKPPSGAVQLAMFVSDRELIGRLVEEVRKSKMAPAKKARAVGTLHRALDAIMRNEERERRGA